MDLHAYLAAIVFTDSPEGAFRQCDVKRELAGVDLEPWFGPGFVEKAKADLEAFEKKVGEELLQEALEYQDDISSDFWFTRNGDGCGFWDGDYPKGLGAVLTEIAKSFGAIDVGDELLGPPDGWDDDEDDDEDSDEEEE